MSLSGHLYCHYRDLGMKLNEIHGVRFTEFAFACSVVKLRWVLHQVCSSWLAQQCGLGKGFA